MSGGRGVSLGKYSLRGDSPVPSKKNCAPQHKYILPVHSLSIIKTSAVPSCSHPW